MYLPLLIVLTLVKIGLGAVDFVDPPSGSVIANFEGTLNVTTLTCNISNNGQQVSTQWNLMRSGSQDLVPIVEGSELFLISGDPDPTDARFSLRNRLTILNLTSELDGVIVYCGTGAQPKKANFRLRLFTIPGQPGIPSADTVGATSISVHWNSPAVVEFPISYYLINASSLNSIMVVAANTITNATHFDVTGLLPGTTYELTVVAVSQGGNIIAKSEPSASLQVTTTVTVPALMCNAPISSSGVIIVTWSYIHTGGLPLTNVSVTYHMSNSTTSDPIPISVSSVDTTSIIVSNLEVGLEYNFNITARNSNGSSSIVCGPILYLLESDNTSTLNTPAIAGGVVGGLTLLAIFAIMIIIIALRKQITGKGVIINGEAEVVYEDPDNIQQYIQKNDQDIKLNECLAYEKPIKQPDIELEECPAYVEKKKEISNIELEECPAYVEKKKEISNIKLEECPAYVESKRTAS